MTDDAILALVSNGKSREEGFRLLVGKYQERLYHIIRSRVSSHEDADDILQDTYIKVFNNLHRFEGRSELFTWMYRIAVNEVSTHHKKQKRRRTEPLNDHEHPRTEPEVRMHDLEGKLEAVVTRLPERQQMVFRMRYYDELTYKEMASLLDLTTGALKASFHHAVKKIEQELSAQQIV